MIVRDSLAGLVLCGGRSRRFGSDKSVYNRQGKPLYEHAVLALENFVADIFISCRSDQSHQYEGMKIILDDEEDLGPMSGLKAFFDLHPTRPVFLLAVDYIDLPQAMIRDLVAHRSPSMHATAYMHEDGVIEPLCTIYESGIQAELRSAFLQREVSLRRLLRQIAIHTIPLPDNFVWQNFNTR